VIPATLVTPVRMRGPNGPRLFALLRSSTVFRRTLLVVVCCTAIQLVLGADPGILALAVVSSVAGLAGFRLTGAYHSAGWLSFFFVFGSVIVALVAKTVFGQPLDSNLAAPMDSFLALAIGSSALLIAIVIALRIPVGKPFFGALSDPRLLRALSHSTFVLGAVAWGLNRVFQDPDGSHFGGIAVFWNLLLMAVVARTAMLLETHQGRRSLDATLVWILLACFAMGLVDNQKTEVALPILAYFATCLFYRGGATRAQVIGGASGLLIMAAIVAPMIHTFRVLGIQDMPWRQRVTFMERGISELLASKDLTRYQKLASGDVQGYYNYFGDGSGQILLGRYSSIQQMDPIIATASRQGALGGAVVWAAFPRLLPTVVYPDKPREIEGYRILVQLGIIDPEGGKYPTVPLLAQVYAAYGMSAVIVIPFITFLGFLLVLKKLGWHLYRNVFAIFFFCVFIVVYTNQADMATYAETALRTFPLLGSLLWVLIHIHGLLAMPRARLRESRSSPEYV
jgi:hypothetical protein